MSRKTISHAANYNQYIKLWYRYMRYVCTIKKISISEATEKFGYHYRTLYSKKLTLKTEKNRYFNQAGNHAYSKSLR